MTSNDEPSRDRVGLVVSCDPAYLTDTVRVIRFSPYVGFELPARHMFLCLHVTNARSVWVMLYSRPLERRIYVERQWKRGLSAWRESISYADPRVLWVAPLQTMAACDRTLRKRGAVANTVQPEGIDPRLTEAAVRALVEAIELDAEAARAEAES